MASPLLLSSKTPEIIVTEIRMMSSTFDGIHFLLEGDDDLRFWKKRLSSCTVTMVTCEGKQNIIGTAVLAGKLGLTAVAGVYDPDFERLRGITHCPKILVPTDRNDLEVTLVVSGALSILLHEYGDEKLIGEFQADTGVSVPDHIENVSSEFGRLRFLNDRLSHEVDFDKLSPYRFVSVADWSLDREGLHAEYAALSSTDPNALLDAIEAHCPPTVGWGYSQGHDCLRILAQGLKRRIGRRQMPEQEVARVLRIAYSVEMLQSSAMYASLRVIENSLHTYLFAEN